MRIWGGEGVWVRREGVSRCGWGWGGSVGAEEGGVGGMSGVQVGREGGGCGCSWGSVWGADLVRMSAPGSFWGLDGTEVLCFRRWEEVRGCIDDRAKGFPCIA